MITKVKCWIGLVVAAALPGPWAANLGADGSDLSASKDVVFPPRQLKDWAETKLSVDRGLQYLRSKQQDSSGALGGHYMVATTSLAGLAVLGAGYTPADPRFGGILLGGLRYLKQQSARTSGFITESEDESRMHGHCYAILFLAELLGSLPPEDEREVSGLIRRGVRVIELAQSRRGGWYYGADNRRDEDEASVTVCALQALRAARNVGFAVDSKRIEDAVKYVEDCQTPDGSFCYTYDARNRTTFALTVAALSTLNAAGVYRSPKLQPGLDFVTRELESARSYWKAVEEEYSFYGNLYAAQTLHQEGGSLWPKWYSSVRAHLFSRQRVDGSWESRFGDEYATAVALLILEVPLGYLPIFQR